MLLPAAFFLTAGALAFAGAAFGLAATGAGLFFLATAGAAAGAFLATGGAATGGATTGAGLAAPRLKGGGDGGDGMMIGGGVRRAVSGTEGPGLAKEIGGEDPAGRVNGIRRPGCEPWGRATRGGGAVGDLGIRIGAFEAGGRPGGLPGPRCPWGMGGGSGGGSGFLIRPST